MFKKDVIDNLDVMHLTILLVDKRVISVSDQERLQKVLKCESSVDAAMDLINMVGLRDEHWFVKLMLCLIDSDQKNIAKKVDAELYESKYMCIDSES